MHHLDDPIFDELSAGGGRAAIRGWGCDAVPVDARFSGVTEGCLAKAGWYPGRNVPLPDGTQAALRAAGHVLLPPARAFLAEFAGLTITQPLPKAPGTPDDLVVDALLAAGGRDPDWVRDSASPP